MHTMRPYLASTMCFCAIWLHRNAPRRCTSMTSRPVVVAHLEQQVVAQHAGVVDQDLQAAELAGQGVDRRLHLVALGDVGAEGEGGPAGLR